MEANTFPRSKYAVGPRRIVVAMSGITIILLGVSSVSIYAQSEIEGTIERHHMQLVEKAARILHCCGDKREETSKARSYLEQARSLTVPTSHGGSYNYRTKEADFYYAWILCRSNQKKEIDNGVELLKKIQKNDQLSSQDKATVEEERRLCESRNPGGSAPTIKEGTFVLVSIQKGGRWSQPLKFPGKSSLALSTWNGRKQAKDAIVQTFGNSYRVVEAKPFLVVGRRDNKYLTSLAGTVLQPYYGYLTNKIGAARRDSIVYVFVASDHNEFAAMTRKVYGRESSDNTWALDAAIAYSDPGSHMMIAICGRDPSNCTSFAHEMFHLVNFASYEDAPWWLYEGMAELYESGDLKDGKFIARVGWRKKDLDIKSLNANSLQALIELSKNDPILYKPPGSAVNMARARFFCMYLHEHDKLWEIYYALRNRSWEETIQDPSGLNVIQKKLGPIQEIARDFKVWIKNHVLLVSGPSHP